MIYSALIDFPVTIPIGEADINPHFIFEVLAFFLGYRFYLFLRKGHTDHLSTDQRVIVIIGAAAGALIFSRLIGVLEAPKQLLSGNISFLQVYASKTIVGGLVGGLLGVEIAKKLIGVKQSTGDLFTLPIILGMIIGRIGCFLSGVSEPTFGIETTLPWGMDLGDGLLRHPTSLYEIFFLATLGLLIHRSSQIFPRAGDAFKTFLIAYLIFRFFIDFIKPTEALALGLTSIQLTCLAGIIYYSKSIFRMSRELFQKKDIS